jgi:hypothetical protein
MVIEERLSQLDWDAVTDKLHDNGFVTLEKLISEEECDGIASLYAQDKYFRKTISMARYRFGEGEYKYFQYPLPPLVQLLRQELYPHLAPIANAWMKAFKNSATYPPILDDFLKQCHEKDQIKPTPLLLTYSQGDYNTLHQDLYGSIYFPIQAVVFLNEPGSDYTGGEFVLIEQRPRAQSKAIVLTPKKGDIAIFTTHSRPATGARGSYKVAMKHGVSILHSGHRKTLGIIFHDAT